MAQLQTMEFKQAFEEFDKVTKLAAGVILTKNIAKGTTDPRVELILQVFTQILIKFHFQNIEQVSISKSQPNMNISTEVKLKYIDQTL